MRRGFTLLEVLVATAIMGLAVSAALTALRTSLRNADRQFELERASTLAARKMDELLVLQNLPRLQPFGAEFPAEITGGRKAGWLALITPYEITTPVPSPGQPAMERVAVEVWWEVESGRRTLRLEGFRRTLLTPEQVDWMGSHPVLRGVGP